MSREERDDLEAFLAVMDLNVNFSLEPISNSEESVVIDLQPRHNSFSDTAAGSSYMFEVSCEIYTMAAIMVAVEAIVNVYILQSLGNKQY